MLRHLTWMMIAAAAAGTAQGQDARWITAPGVDCPLLRTEFTLAEKPARAVIRIAGLGHFQLRVNGQDPGGRTAIHQPWSKYDRTIYFEEIDLVPFVQRGGNAIGVMLGNSFWHCVPVPKGRYHKVGLENDYGTPYLLWVEAEFEAPGGMRRRIVSDETWKTSPGPVTFSHVYAGEDYDARLEQAGWDSPGFNHPNWKPAAQVEAPRGRLEKQFWPPLREATQLPAQRITSSQAGVYHVFFGQNASGILRFTAEGKAGQSFTVQSSEYRTEDGRFMEPKWGDPVLFRYTLKGGEPERHQWLFHYNGFQGIELRGAVPAGQPNPDALPVVSGMEIVHVHTDLPRAGMFQASGEACRYNDIHLLIDWAMRSNMSYVLTDCPHREKLGWLECTYLLFPTFSYRYDCRDWFTKIVRDIRESQEPSGRILTVAPSYAGTRLPDAFTWTVEWGAAGALLPWHHYTWYGDPQILRDNYDCMRRFVDFVASESKDSIAPGGLGDWYDYGHGQPPGPSRFTPTTLTATAVQVMCIDAVIGAAGVLHKVEDVARYRRLREQTSAAFLKAFYNPATKTFAHKDSPQCAHTIALAAGLVPEPDKTAVLDAVLVDLAKRGWQQTPGDVGHVFFIRALAEGGRSDVLHRVYSRDGLGSYGGILKKGLTAMPETWDAMTDGHQSHNHCMLGHVMEWFYGYVGGIRQHAGDVGWKRALIAPVPGPLSHAEVTFESPAGRIISRWTVENGKFTLRADVPDGVRATLRAPDGTSRDVGGGKHELEGRYARAAQ